MNEDRNALRRSLRERFPRDRAQLLPALHYLQHEFGFLPGWAVEAVGWHLGIPVSEVYGAATSYTELRLQRHGRHVVRVCTGLSCWLNGGRELLALASQSLGVVPGQTTGDGLVTLEQAECAFMCGMAPVVETDGAWRGRVDEGSARKILAEVTRA